MPPPPQLRWHTLNMLARMLLAELTELAASVERLEAASAAAGGGQAKRQPRDACGGAEAAAGALKPTGGGLPQAAA